MELHRAEELGVRDRILALRALETLRVLDNSSLSLIAEQATFRRFEPGEVILEEGRIPPRVFMILEGAVDVDRAGIRVTTVQRNFGVGFLSLLGSDEQGVTATVREPTRALEVPAAAVLGAFEEDFALARNSLRLAAVSVARMRGGMPTGEDNPEDADPGDPANRPTTMVERVIQMRQGPLFRDSNLDAVVELARRGRNAPFEKGDVLWRQGEPASSYLRIDDGLIRCTDDTGKESIVGASFILGVMDTFGQLPRSYTATAITPGSAFHLDTQVFMGVLETHHDLIMRLIATINRPLLVHGS